MPGRQLSAIEQLAVGIAVKSDTVSELKRVMKDGDSSEVCVVVRISGRIAKSFGTPPGTSEGPADVALHGSRFLAAVFKQLGVTPEQLTAAAQKVLETVVKPDLVAITDDLFPESDVFSGVRDFVTNEVQAKLPKKSIESGGKAGSVSSQLKVEVLELGFDPAAEPAAAPEPAPAAPDELPPKPARKKAATVPKSDRKKTP